MLPPRGYKALQLNLGRLARLKTERLRCGFGKIYALHGICMVYLECTDEIIELF